MKRVDNTKLNIFVTMFILVLLLFFFQFGFTGYAVANPNQDQTLSLISQDTTVQIDDTITINVELAQGEDIYSYDMGFTYADDLLELQNVQETNYLGQTKDVDYLCIDYKTSTLGEINDIACTTTGTTTANSGTHNIQTLTFKAIDHGSSLVDFTKEEVASWADVATEDSTPIIYDWRTINLIINVENPNLGETCEGLGGDACTFTEICEGSLLDANDTSTCCDIECAPEPPICTDNDEDGYNQSTTGCGPVDCNDNNDQINPGMEEICNGVDDDCDMLIDEEGVCGECTPGEIGNCELTSLSGPCKDGKRTCSSAREWGDCEQQIFPEDEICGDNIDNNCNGETDELEICGACTPGDTQNCELSGLFGPCQDGISTCTNDYEWGTCIQQVFPDDSETCNDNIDNDCNGETDDGCGSECTPTNTMECELTLLNGPCKTGLKTCSENNLWGNCEQQIFPTTEVCDDNIDNDCDGVADEGCGGGGGGGGGCNSNWECEVWTPCMNGKHTRVCTDSNSCSSKTVKTETENCEMTCSDGIKNQDETGIDCGGAVCNECEKYPGISLSGLLQKLNGEILSYSKVEFTLKNDGTETIKDIRVRIIELNKEFIIGKISEGESITRTETILIPYDFSAQKLTLEAYKDNTLLTTLSSEAKIKVPKFTVHFPRLENKKIKALILVDNRNNVKIDQVIIKAMVYDGNKVISTKSSPMYTISPNQIFTKSEEFDFSEIGEGEDYEVKFLYMQDNKIIAEHKDSLTMPNLAMEESDGIDIFQIIFWASIGLVAIAAIFILRKIILSRRERTYL